MICCWLAFVNGLEEEGSMLWKNDGSCGTHKKPSVDADENWKFPSRSSLWNQDIGSNLMTVHRFIGCRGDIKLCELRRIHLNVQRASYSCLKTNQLYGFYLSPFWPADDVLYKEFRCT